LSNKILRIITPSFFFFFSSFHQKTIFLICLRGNCEHELKCCENKEK
jgi:hypothetical protein